MRLSNLRGRIVGGGRGRRGGCRSGLAQNLKHDGAASGALALDGFAAVFHGFFDAIGDGLFGLALDAVSFRHKDFTVNASCVERQEQATGYKGQGQI
jgi:hypothetical protein